MANFKENYKRIREQYTTGYLRARAKAEERRTEVHLIPEIAEIDRRMQGIGLELFKVAAMGGDIETRIAELRRTNEDLQRERRLLLVANGYPADYTEVKYNCPTCGDTGYVDCKMCGCLKQALVTVGYESSGMGNLMRKQSFENFSLDYYRDDPHNHVTMTRIYAIMREYAETFVPRKSGNLVLFGGTGLGKTHLSSAVANVVIGKGYDVYYTGAVGMFSDFQIQRFGHGEGSENGENTERYFNCDLLIIDDLGAEVINQFTTSVLYDIVNTRLNRGLSTVISTNLNREAFLQSYWDRITSRILGEYRILPFAGKDIRSRKLK